MNHSKGRPMRSRRAELGAVRRRRLAIVVLLAALLWGATAAQAQGEPPGRDPKRSRTLVVLRISEALDLDEEQTIRLAAEYRRFDRRRRELIGERSKAEVALETAIGGQPQDEADLRRKTDELLAIDRELVLLPDALFESLQDMLSTDQRARLALLKIKLQRKIDRERGRRAGHQLGGGRPAPAGPGGGTVR